MRIEGLIFSAVVSLKKLNASNQNLLGDVLHPRTISTSGDCCFQLPHPIHRKENLY